MSYYSNNGTPWNTCPGSRYNPIQHIQEAWNETRTVYGRWGVILFYSYVWFNIFDSILAIINSPTVRQHEMKNCSSTEVEIHIETMLLQQLNYFALGFLLYSHWYRFDLSNVTTVMVITLLYSHSVYQLIHNFPHSTPSSTNDENSSGNVRFLVEQNEENEGDVVQEGGECAINGGYAVMAVFSVLWIVAAWCCLLIEHRLVGPETFGGPSSQSFMGASNPGSFSQLGTRLMGGSPNIPMTTGFMGMQEYYDNSNRSNGGDMINPNNPRGNNTELTPLQF